MKIQNALNNYGGNFARPTKFTVMISPPMMLASGGERAVDILCKSISIPETSLEPIEISYKGHKLKLPGRTNQSQIVTCTFYMDERYDIRRMFQDWLDIMDPSYYAKGPVPSTNSEKYGDMVVEARDFNESGRVVEQFSFENLFPITVGEMEYSADSKDTVMEITVTFAYYRMIGDSWNQHQMDNQSSGASGSSTPNLLNFMKTKDNYGK